MIEFFLRNPFRATLLGAKRFLKYADVHAERLRAALPGLPAAPFTAQLAATDAAIAAYRQQVQGGAQQGAKRLGQTTTNDQATRRFQKYVGQQAKILAALYTDIDKDIKGETTAAYQQFFPQGVTALTEANKADLDTEAAVFLQAAADQQDQVGAALLARGQALWQAVTDSRTAQLKSMGGEETTHTQRGTAREGLADALFQNLLALLLHHFQTPAQVLDYFPEAILKEFTGQAAAAPAAALPA